MSWASGHNPGIGPTVQNEEFVFWNRGGATAVAVGDVMMVDHLAADGASLSTAALNAEGTASGQLTWPDANLLDPTAAGIGALSGATTAGTGAGGADLVVITDLLGGTGADNTKVRAAIRGLVYIKCLTTEPVVYGDSMYAAAARTLTPIATAGVRCVAKSKGAKADNATNLVLCRFEGGQIFSQAAAS